MCESYTSQLLRHAEVQTRMIEASFGCSPFELQRRRHQAWLKRPVAKFIGAVGKQFEQLENGHFTMDDQAYIEIDVTGLSEDRGHEYALLFRSLYVLPDHRNQGLAAEAIERVTKTADATGCSIFVVCSPFELQGMSTDVAGRRKFWLESSAYSLLEHNFDEEQDRMAARFVKAGFENVAIPELLSGDSRCTNHCFLYMPEAAPDRFREQMEGRLVA
jgi:GNAT superfamily N-acetyltransferase